jgi:hypothetical protein
MQIIRAVWFGERPLHWLFTAFTLVSLVAPTVVFWSIYVILRTIENTTLPYFSIYITAVVIVLTLIPLATWLGVGSYRAAGRVGRLGMVLKGLILTSVFWVPSSAFWVFMHASVLFRMDLML